MSLLAREVARFILDVALWLGLVTLLTIVAGSIAGVLQGRRVLHRNRIGWAVVGGSVAAALAVRIGAPLAWSPHIGTRPLPVAWTAAGALIGAWLSSRHEAKSTPL